MTDSTVSHSVGGDRMHGDKMCAPNINVQSLTASVGEPQVTDSTHV